jgi:enoyl-CoA hydratase
VDFNRYKTLLLSRRGRVLEVKMNAPERLNAIGQDMHAELARVFTDIANDPETDIAVLTGAGRAFSAGGDLEFMQVLIDEPGVFADIAREGKQIVTSLLECEKPVIAKVNGNATGLGATIALFCDVIFASDKARIGDPHVLVGLTAGDGGAAIWPQLIGFARAKEYLMTGELIPAVKAAEIGLVNHVVPAEELDARVDAFADRLAAGATQAIRWTKMSVNVALKPVVHAVMDASLAYEGLSNSTRDHAEAVTAFREKRAPKFCGK